MLLTHVLHQGKPFIWHLGLMGDTMAVTQEIFVVEFGQESKFVFIMQEL
jgi:hypothetical protein